MRITILTPTLNSEKYLSHCLRSVQQQDYPDIEHIVLDGGSTDGTLDIVQSFSTSVSKYISEKDGGMYHAINKGIKIASGEIIGVLNSDDFLADNTVISRIAEVFSSSATDSLYADLLFVSPHNVDEVRRRWTGTIYNREKFRMGWMPAHPTFYVRKKVIENFGDYETHFFTSSDYEFMCRLLFHHNVSSTYLPKVTVKMRLGGASNGSIKHRLRANRRDFLAMKKNNIPYPFFISVLKPLTKLHQYNWPKKLSRSLAGLFIKL